ncbi:AAA family ATPase [Cellulomonas sp. H30R-01]|uniref:AAA family ATPase n=1 Tax=Cellulomonas sp. H30R-01 TaxID=2704467 RepID=UPI00138C8EB7|nr:AAA family ATPase [Cellulomonas sp. H30R-01]QHT57985.1 AAA family ATPase [Cellulomonas sp. H30R-01]
MSTSAEPGRTWPLVGRAAELDDLDDLLASAAGGHGATVLVEGEAGIGRTGLVDALGSSARLLSLGLRTARATPERPQPYALLSDALLAHPPGVARGPVESELADLIDALRADVRRATVRGVALAEERRARAVELFAALLRRRGDGGPWVLVLEDVHDADAASLDVLRALAHEGDVPGALVVMTFRPVPVRTDLSHVVDAWVRAGARPVELRPLGPAATVELAQRLVGCSVGPALRGALATTGGNPRFVTDVVRTARSAGALEARDGVVDVHGAAWLAALDTLVRTRLDYLDDDVLDLLAHASVLGTSFVVTDLATLVSRPVPDCWRTLRVALAAGLVHARADRLVFRHDVVRGALYAGLDEPRRRAVHARAAWALREAGAPTQIVAGHLERAR